MFHYGSGPEAVMDGIFFDTGAGRGRIADSLEEEDRDLAAHIDIVNYTKNIWRDHHLDREAVVITNVGGSANPRQIVEGGHDSITLREQDINVYPNYYKGECSHPDPYWADDLNCIWMEMEGIGKEDRKVWAEQFDNLIKYGPLHPQIMFIQGWFSGNIANHTMEMFGENFIDRFLRFVTNTHIGVVTFSHSGNGHPVTPVGEEFYEDLFSRPLFQPCPGTWGQWGEWSNCDRSCLDGIRMRERECSAGSSALCDGSGRDMEVCNDQPCYQWPNKGWAHWEEWSSCSKSCNGGTRERRRFCKNDDNRCDETGKDYDVEVCNEDQCPSNRCAKELRINVPTSLHTEKFFPYEGLYHRTESMPTSSRPTFIKFHRDIELSYREDMSAWIVRDNSIGKIVLISYTDAFCPEHISQSDWNYINFETNNFINGNVAFEIAMQGGDYLPQIWCI